ncbi:MAG: ankyrin repeat domain-containing protein [Planctomycetota bacterium]
MRHIRLLCLVLVGTLALPACRKQEPDPARQSPTQPLQAAEPAEAEGGPAKPAVARWSPRTATSTQTAESLEGAIAKGDFEQVQSFIASGADVTRKSANGATPLHIALMQGHEDIAMLLITKSPKAPTCTHRWTTARRRCILRP